MSTVRIEVDRADGKSGMGTGFFFRFESSNQTSSIPAVVTCWHVVSNSTRGRLIAGPRSSIPGSNGLVPLSLSITSNFAKHWIRHPDTNVDLAAMPIAPFINELDVHGLHLHYAPLDKHLIPEDAELKELEMFQEVKFIGYPIGIWDEANRLPIVRRGITATGPIRDYNGRAEFLIDAAVFPGSSGSPVFIFNEGGDYAISGRTLHIKPPKLRFLGVLYAVYQYTSEGEVRTASIPSTIEAKARVPIPGNLGLVLKARQLQGFNEVFDELLLKQREASAKVPQDPQFDQSQPPDGGATRSNGKTQ